MRVSPIAKPGSLLKGTKPAKKWSKPKSIGADADYLKDIRRCPCLGCDNDPAGEAAHVRMSDGPEKQGAMGKKPDDRWTVPLCHGCHMQQHQVGEKTFWERLGLNPIAACASLWAWRHDIGEMRRACMMLRGRRRL